MSTIETFTVEHEAGLDYIVTLQSRSFSGMALTNGGDVYTVTLTQNDGGGS